MTHTCVNMVSTAMWPDQQPGVGIMGSVTKSSSFFPSLLKVSYPSMHARYPDNSFSGATDNLCVSSLNGSADTFAPNISKVQFTFVCVFLEMSWSKWELVTPRFRSRLLFVCFASRTRCYTQGDHNKVLLRYYCLRLEKPKKVPALGWPCGVVICAHAFRPSMCGASPIFTHTNCSQTSPLQALFKSQLYEPWDEICL